MALTGNLRETSLADLVQFYSITRQTAAVTITYPGGEPIGVLYIEGGDVTDARFGDLFGVEAVHYGLLLKDGDFRVELGLQSDHRTIFEPWGQLVLSELGADEAALDAGIAGLSQDENQRSDSPESELGGEIFDPAPEPVAARAPTPGSPRPVSIPNRPRETQTAPPPETKTAPPPEAKTLPPPAQRNFAVPIALAVAIATVLLAAWVLFVHKAEPAPIAPIAATAPVHPQPLPPPPPPPPPTVQGISDGEILFGMSAPFSGPARELGREMKVGIDVAFAAANASGGVNGRKLKLIAFDDGYEPERAKAGMKQLDERDKVFGYIGNVGTPTAEVTVPYALEKKMLFFGPFTGAGLLRKSPPDRYVFNYRASYVEETAAIVKYLVEVRRIKPTDIAVFAQEDGFGDAGYSGVVKMLRRYKRTIDDPLRVGYKRNTIDVANAVEAILESRKVHAVVMVATYKAAAKFIEKVKSEQPKMIFSNVSFVGSAALAEELVGFDPKIAEGLLVTQVVPLPQSRSTALLKYQELLATYSLGEKPDFVSLEGYLAATLLIEGLRKAGRTFNTESLVDVLESMHSIDLGVGAPLGFGMSEHQASHKVWGSVLDRAGNYSEVDLE